MVNAQRRRLRCGLAADSNGQRGRPRSTPFSAPRADRRRRNSASPSPSSEPFKSAPDQLRSGVPVRVSTPPSRPRSRPGRIQRIRATVASCPAEWSRVQSFSSGRARVASSVRVREVADPKRRCAGSSRPRWMSVTPRGALPDPPRGHSRGRRSWRLWRRRRAGDRWRRRCVA
jgi:hypothetical protein